MAVVHAGFQSILNPKLTVVDSKVYILEKVIETFSAGLITFFEDSELAIKTPCPLGRCPKHLLYGVLLAQFKPVKFFSHTENGSVNYSTYYNKVSEPF
jgi:hypothetical protein